MIYSTQIISNSGLTITSEHLTFLKNNFRFSPSIAGEEGLSLVQGAELRGKSLEHGLEGGGVGDHPKIPKNEKYIFGLKVGFG